MARAIMIRPQNQSSGLARFANVRSRMGVGLTKLKEQALRADRVQAAMQRMKAQAQDAKEMTVNGISVVSGGAIAGGVDGLNEGKGYTFKGVPYPAIGGAALSLLGATGILGKTASKPGFYAGAGALAYTAGTAVRGAMTVSAQQKKTEK